MTDSASQQTRQSALLRNLRKVMRPLVRILLRNGIDCVSVEEEIRRVYAGVAMNEFALQGRKPTVSRAATLTGLSRKEVSRLLQMGDQVDTQPVSQNRAASVVAGWVRDPDFQDGRGEPRPLSMDDVGGGFPALVKRYSRDVPPITVLDELVRVGAAERLPDGRARLLARSYVPTRDDAAKLEFLGTDARHLIETIAHNITHSGADARYQRKVLYDDVPVELAERFRHLAAERCQALLEELDRVLSNYDRGANPAVSGEGRRLTGVGMFYFEEDVDLEAGADAPPEGAQPS